MNRCKYPRLLALLLLGMYGLPAHAERDYGDPAHQPREFEYDDSQDQPWQESRIKPPPLPADENLLRAEVDRLPPGLQLYIDSTSLQLDENDGVLRFWLVLKSAAGAYNATYEGLRCESREYKVYAYGNPRREPQVRAAPQPQWKSYRGYNLVNYRQELANTLMCNSGLTRPLPDIIATLKGQRSYIQPATQNNFGF